MILGFLKTYTAYLKGAAIGAVGGFIAGHIVTSNAWEADKAERTVTIVESIPQIIRETQTITKVIHDSKDACAGTTISPAILERLR